MHTALWIAAGVLAAAFLTSGTLKLTQDRPKLVEQGLTYVEDFSETTIKAIGATQVLAAVGLILPAIFDIATFLVPLAASGLVVTMIGAAIVHARRGETQSIGLNLVLGAAALFVAWGRFGPHSL